MASKPICVSAQAPGSPLSWGSRQSGPLSWMASEFHQPGSGAELTSSFLCSQRFGSAPADDVQGLLRAEMGGKHSASRASACSIVSDQLVGMGRGSAAEVTSLVVNELNEATEQQLWRQQSVAGSVVVFVTAGYEGKRFVFEIAYQMELTVVIIDDEGSWSQQLVEEGLAEKFIPLNIQDLDASYDECVALISEVRGDLGRLDAILSFCELAQPLVARLTTHFKLPGNSVESVLAARDKHLSREAFRKAGLPTPKFFLITEEAHCDEAAAHVGFPAVIKPILGAASIGVMRVNSLEELRKGVQEVRSQLLHARVVHGALQEGTPEYDRQGSDASAWIQLSIMMEEYLDGPEVDVDVAVADGVSYYEAITDNWPTIEPYFNETGSNCPSLLPPVQQRELRTLAVASIQALGLTTGVCHVEAKYTSRGPRLIEVNCRMGGGPVQLINRLVYGVDLAAEQLILSCGGEPFERIEDREPLCNIAEYSMNSPTSGYILHTDFLKEWQGHPRLLYARPLVHARQRVIGSVDGMPTWLCEVMCTAPSVEEGIQFVKEIEKSIAFPIVDRLPDEEQP
eukprot:EG_transcript_4807